MRLTIGMPVHNGASTIATALDALLAQTVGDFTIIISDNASTDATEEICRRYAALDGRIRYVRHDADRGAAMNFRFVLFEADTPYFMWAAADDRWAPGFVEENLRELAEHPEAVASQSRVLFTKAGRPSHLSAGTFALTGAMKENIARYLRNPADNSRYYGVFRTDVLKAVFPGRSFHALDWGVAAATLKYGTHRELGRVLMIRDSSDARAYEISVSRDHRFLLWRIMPVLFVTRWLIRDQRIPLTFGIANSLARLNIYIHLRYGLYRIGWLADRYVAAISRGGVSFSFSAMLGPQLGSRIRSTAVSAARGLRGLLRPVWRALPLSLRAREAVKFHLTGMFGAVATEAAGATDYRIVAISALQPMPADPAARGGENVWHLPPCVAGRPECAVTAVLMAADDVAVTLRTIDALNAPGGGCEGQLETVVLDAGSSDVTAAALGGLPGLSYRRLEEFTSLVEALRYCLGGARSRAVVILEPGVVPLEGFASSVLKGLERLAVLQPQLRDEDGYVVDVHTATGIARLPPSHPVAAASRPIHFAVGAVAFMRDALDGIGTADLPETFGALSEILVGHARSCGRRAGTWPDAVVHIKGPHRDGSHQESRSVSLDARVGELPTLLYVDSDTPTPDQNAGSILAVSLMRMFDSLGFRVLFAPEGNLAHRGRYTEDLLALGIVALYARHFSSMEQIIRQFGRDLKFVVLCRPDIAERYLPIVRELAPNARVVFNTVDLHFLREMREAELTGDQAARARAQAREASELALVRAADATIVVSSHEHALLQKAVPDARLHLIPLVRDVPERLDVPGFLPRRHIAFIGTYLHPPNEDAAIYFAREIWPRLREQLPEARFLVCGSSVTTRIEALAGDGIDVLGFVEDLNAVLATCRLTVAPLRFGAGLKGKVVSSLEAGVPVVGSSIAVEGSGLTDGAEVLVADTPEETAAAILRVYRDRDLWERLSRDGFEFVRREYAIERHLEGLAAFLAQLR